MKNSVQRSFHVISLPCLGLLSSLAVGCAGSQTPPQTLADGAGCHELAGDDAILKQFYEPGTVVGAQPIRERAFKARAIQPMETVGAKLYVRAEPNLTAPYLRRVLACHADSGAAAHPNDPLLPTSGPVTDLAVSETRSGFAVSVRSSQPQVGQEIWQRAEALSQGGGSVKAEQVAQTEPRVGFSATQPL